MHLVHSQVGEDDGEVSLYPHDESCLPPSLSSLSPPLSLLPPSPSFPLSTYLVYSQVREDDGEVNLYPHDESCLPLMATSNHSHMVTHDKVLAKLPRLELQRVLETVQEKRLMKCWAMKGLIEYSGWTPSNRDP